MSEYWQVEESKPTDKFTWIYRDTENGREYIAGTVGRIRIGEARALAEALNNYSLYEGDCK